jgi:hypothetical protein
MGSGGNADGSGAPPAGTVACNCGPQVIQGKPTGAQGRLRPEHRKRRGSSSAGPACGNATESNELSVARAGQLAGPCPYAGSGLARGRCGGDMSTPQKCPSTRHYLKTTSDNRR